MDKTSKHFPWSLISMNTSSQASRDKTLGADPHFMDQERAIESYLTQMEILDPALMKQSRSVAHYTRLMARRLGFAEDKKRKLQHSSLVHDLGMLAIERKILEKRDTLTPEEWKLIKAHPLNTAKILSYIPHFQEIIPIVKHHHECYDGTGYPDSLMGNDIPLMSRIIAIADAFVAMITDRPYRDPLSIDEALVMIQNKIGSQFDPKLVPFFATVVEKELRSFPQEVVGKLSV